MTNNFNKNALNWQARSTPKKFPDFVDKALMDYFDGRKNKIWNGEHILQGKRPTINSLIFSSNDYLHISQHPNLINAQINAMKEFGNGQMQSAVYLSNNSPLLEQSENQMAEFLDYPAALLSQSGWCANVGLIQALANRSVPVYLDFYAHMSFWAGVKAANAKPIPFQHNSIDSLHKRLQRYGPGIIAVDSIYSTIGSISPLYDYVDLAKTYQCLLIVDESHSLGTHGPQGKGLVASFGLSDQVDIITASLAKALSGRGGVVASNQQFIEYIRYSSLPAIFSSSLVPHDFAGFNASIDVIKSEEWRRTKLHANADYLRSALEHHEFKLHGSNSQIIPIICGDEEHTMQIRKELEQEDIFGAVFCAPATPKNKSLIRLSVSCNHELEDLNHVINCLIHLSKKYPKLAFMNEGC